MASLRFRGTQRGRGRNGGGGEGGGGARGRKKGHPETGTLDMELVEVPIAQSSDFSGPAVVADGDGCALAGGGDLSKEDRVKRALVAGPKQPRDQCYMDPVGLLGGLALWWKDGIDVDVRFKSKNIFRCVVKWPSSPSSWLCTFIYAPPTWHQRVEFWDKLRRIYEENQFPWLCVGDFNELMSDCKLLDLEFKGQSYTWSNNQGGSSNIRERLDRAVANVEWRDLFPYAQVFHDVILGSDHAPLIVKVCIPLKKVPYRFKFESMWCTSEECGEIISGAWNSVQRGSEQTTLAQKLTKCRDALKVWSKKQFGNNLEKIRELKSQLGFVQSKAHSEENFRREKAIKEELEVTLLREKMYQHQRSRLIWIVYGDKNTSFFHATVNQRRQQNQLSKIKKSDGVQITEERDIKEHLHGHFSSLRAKRVAQNTAHWALAPEPPLLPPARQQTDLLLRLLEEGQYSCRKVGCGRGEGNGVVEGRGGGGEGAGGEVVGGEGGGGGGEGAGGEGVGGEGGGRERRFAGERKPWVRTEKVMAESTSFKGIAPLSMELLQKKKKKKKKKKQVTNILKHDVPHLRLELQKWTWNLEQSNKNAIERG
ncbi:hypothetical protein RHGRI_015079 [Rhododendron griersonianum]|uniref:Endonuclease/exonuclease/phosphatase domain-containing protein n=1 Tax=Rhododendron griersonianum TaxID=479676 RepID=A0AAV6KBV7_9ERIC|nr:hypothetical protein RHGRI_015079 [Rhododendron griersonianum]